jgi:predicted CXXCH cytochrome family protein
MAPLFSPAADTILRVVVVLVLALALVAAVGPMVYVRGPVHQRRGFPLDQPVQFDHRHHVRDDGIDCLYCHDHARSTAYAGVPPTELCMGCHSQVWPRSIQLEPVRHSYFSGLPLVWSRVTELPGYVYFNHAIHVNKGVGCVECHGRVDRMPLATQVAPLSMGWCLGCHRDPAPHLRPADQITNMTWRSPGPELGHALEVQNGVRRLTYCTACHR